MDTRGHTPPSEAIVLSKLADPKRLDALRRIALLDTPREECFDRLTRLAAKLTGVPATFVSLVDQNRDFYKSAFGFGEPLASVRQLEGRTFCHYAIAAEEPLVIDDVTKELVFRDVPTVQSLGVRAYVGIPLVTENGEVVGSFCAIDFQPKEWTERDIDILSDLARSTMREIELRRVIQESESTNLRLVEQMEKVKELNDRLEVLTTTDSLTGVNNRRAFEHSLAQELLLVKRRSTPLSLVIVDVDHFKLINDTYGHAAGDVVLQTIATLLIKSARNVDMVARIGGEEFAVVLPNTDGTSAMMVAERMRAAVADEAWPNAPLTISLGIATLLNLETASSLFVRADKAMYVAKESGRNCVVQA
ncbi:MAG: sensor domain-containing diguanylate cyclase [Burkholderiaceae bacterium]